MTATDIYGDARVVLHDPSGTRYTAAILRPMLNRVQTELYALRPESMLADDELTLAGVEAPAKIVDDDQELPMGESWRPCLVQGLLAEAYQIDTDEHEANAAGRAAAHRGRFEKLAMTL